MRVFLAGGSGVLGRALIPLLTAAGHQVTAMTRSASKTALLEGLGATAALADAYDRDALLRCVERARPQAVVHLLTDLSSGDPASNARLRTTGTGNLVDAAIHAGVDHMVAESISWVYRPGTTLADEDEPLDLAAPAPRATTIAGVHALETAVLAVPRGVVLRFGQLFGPGTWYARDGRFGRDARAGQVRATETVASFIHVADAARAAAAALDWPPGICNIVDDEPAAGHRWAPCFAAAVGGPEPVATESGDIGRPVSNARAHGRGFAPRFASWRDGFATL